MNNDFGSFPSHKSKLAYNKKQWFCIQFPPQHKYMSFPKHCVCMCTKALEALSASSNLAHTAAHWFCCCSSSSSSSALNRSFARRMHFSVECSSSYLGESSQHPENTEISPNNTNSTNNKQQTTQIRQQIAHSALWIILNLLLLICTYQLHSCQQWVAKAGWSSGIGVSWKGWE